LTNLVLERLRGSLRLMQISGFSPGPMTLPKLSGSNSRQRTTAPCRLCLGAEEPAHLFVDQRSRLVPR